jgi:hypothetical protein
VDRRACIEPDADAVVRAEDLEADVVAEWIVACPRKDSEGAAGETEDGDGGVEVAVVLEPLRCDRSTVGVHLSDLPAGHEPDRVEVVNGEVAEHTARGGDVFACGRRRIVSRRSHREDAPDRA